MKKSIIITCIISVFLYTGVAAENSSGERATFGVKAGVNYSNVWDEQGQDFRADPKFGFAGGIFVGIPLGEHVGFQPELLVSQKGFQGSGTLIGMPYSYTKTTTYLDVPLQLQIKPGEMFVILLGPQYSFLLTEKNEYSFGANHSEQREEFENDNIRKNIFGFVVGSDVYVAQNIVLSGKMGWDILNNHGDGSSSTPRYKNRWLQFTLGFKL
jgi:hypothetical protein